MLSTRQVATRLGVHPRTVEAMRAAGTGPAWTRIGGVIRYDEAQLTRWISEHTVTATAVAR